MQHAVLERLSGGDDRLGGDQAAEETSLPGTRVAQEEVPIQRVEVEAAEEAFHRRAAVGIGHGDAFYPRIRNSARARPKAQVKEARPRVDS